MKANELIRELGVGRIKHWIKEFTQINKLPDEMLNIEYVAELKRLVESHELVDKHGGILRAKSHYEKYKAMGSESNIILFSAIADVESCL